MAAFDCGGAPLLGGGEIRREMVEGMLDFKGTIAVRSSTGGWKSAAYIIGGEVAERFAFYGISSNLITYLTGPLRLPTAVAAINVDVWSCGVFIFPVVGAFVADSYLGRYRTILYSSLLYVTGLGLLTLSALLPSLTQIHCKKINNKSSCPPPRFQVILSFISMYIVAFAQGGHKPCTQAFGADQFDGLDPKESKSRSSFFNWWYCGLCWGSIFSFTILPYIQDNRNWVLGFGFPCISMVFALVVFLLGTKTYRYSVNNDEMNTPVDIGRVFVGAGKNWRSTLPSSGIEEQALGRPHQFKFLNKTLVNVANNQDTSTEDSTVCTLSQVEDAKSMLQLIPIWCTSLIYGVICAQKTTFFVKQGSYMDRSIGTSFQIPSASLLTFMSLSIVLFILIYDCCIVPITRVFTNRPNGITMLQRIGLGILLSIITMVVAALVERRRLKIASDLGLIDVSEAMVPMSIWWLLPQYCLIGIADVFTQIGLQEFFYDQVPNGLKSLGIALYWSVFGVGSFVSGFLILVIQKITSDGGGDSWFSNNLNRGHLDYFYWLLAGFSAVEFFVYLYFARLYKYNTQSST